MRLGASPLVDDATFRIALPSPWIFTKISVSHPLPDGSFRITLPEGDYQVGAILARLGGGLPRIYSVKALTSGSANLLSQPLKVSGTEPVEIRTTFGTIMPNEWLKLSGRVLGVDSGSEENLRVVLSGEVIAPLAASINPDGSFQFPTIIRGRYILRVVSKAMETAASQFPRNPSDRVINVTDKDVTGIEIVWRSQ